MVQRGHKRLQTGDFPKKLVALLLVLVGTLHAELLDKVVANVNGYPILESELKIASMFYGINDREKLIEKLVEKHLIAQFLKERGLSIPEGYVDELIRDIAKNNKKSVDEFFKELYEQGLSPRDLREFLKVEIASTLGLREFLMTKVNVSDIEIELERLKSGDVRYLKEIELLVVEDSQKDKVLEAVNLHGRDLHAIAKFLGMTVEKLKVGKGELIESLDREVWRANRGELVVAQDEKNIYLAKVVRTIRVFSGRSEDDIRRELVSKKIEKEREELVRTLKKQSLVEVYG